MADFANAMHNLRTSMAEAMRDGIGGRQVLHLAVDMAMRDEPKNPQTPTAQDVLNEQQEEAGKKVPFLGQVKMDIDDEIDAEEEEIVAEEEEIDNGDEEIDNEEEEIDAEEEETDAEEEEIDAEEEEIDNEEEEIDDEEEEIDDEEVPLPAEPARKKRKVTIKKERLYPDALTGNIANIVALSSPGPKTVQRADKTADAPKKLVLKKGSATANPNVQTSRTKSMRAFTVRPQPANNTPSKKPRSTSTSTPPQGKSVPKTTPQAKSVPTTATRARSVPKVKTGSAASPKTSK